MARGGSVRVCAIINQLGWAYVRRAEALAKRCPDDLEIEISLEDPEQYGVPAEPFDVIFLLDYSKVGKTRQAMTRMCASATPLVVSFNTGWPRRQDYFQRCREYADFTIINNREYWELAGCLPDTAYLPNGVDFSVFHVQCPLTARTPKVLWCGGTLGSNAFRSDLKGYDSILIPAGKRINAMGIETDFFAVDPHGGDWQRPTGLRRAAEMALWYNSGTVYVCASSVEGTPNPALEAAACGCTIVSTRVGNMPELVAHGQNGYLVERAVDDLVEHVVKAVEDYPRLATNMQSSIKAWSWGIKAEGFFALFRKLAGTRL